MCAMSWYRKKFHHRVNVSFAGYGYGNVCTWPFTFTIRLRGTLPKYVFQLNKTRTDAACGFAGILSTFHVVI